MAKLQTFCVQLGWEHKLGRVGQVQRKHADPSRSMTCPKAQAINTLLHVGAAMPWHHDIGKSRSIEEAMWWHDGVSFWMPNLRHCYATLQGPSLCGAMTLLRRRYRSHLGPDHGASLSLVWSYLTISAICQYALEWEKAWTFRIGIQVSTLSHGSVVIHMTLLPNRRVHRISSLCSALLRSRHIFIECLRRRLFWQVA